MINRNHPLQSPEVKLPGKSPFPYARTLKPLDCVCARRFREVSMNRVSFVVDVRQQKRLSIRKVNTQRMQHALGLRSDLLNDLKNRF